MIEIQQQLSERAVELLALPVETTCFILDVGYVISYMQCKLQNCLSFFTSFQCVQHKGCSWCLFAYRHADMHSFPFDMHASLPPLFVLTTA